MVNIKDEKLYRCFREVLPDIWLFWELALLCEPIVLVLFIIFSSITNLLFYFR